MQIAMAELTAQQVQELVHRISGLEQMNQQLQTQQTTAENTVALVSAVESRTTGSITGCCEATRGNDRSQSFFDTPAQNGKGGGF